MPFPPYCFATLTPENEAAQKCLESLVDSQPPESHVHGVTVANTRQINPTDRAAQSKYRLALSFSGSENDTNSLHQKNFWVVGRLRRNCTVNLPLCTARSRQLKGDHFFSISIHPQSGAVLLENNSTHHSILYLGADQNTDVELHYADTFILYKRMNRLRIGPLDLLLELTARDEAVYATYLEKFMQAHYRDWDHNRRTQEYSHFDLLPKPTQYEMKNLVVHHTISKGAFGVVRAGIKKDSGMAVACKTIHCPLSQVMAVRREIEISMQIPVGTVGLVRLMKSWCEHGHQLPCAGAKVEDVHLLMPYAPFTFANAPWQNISLHSRLAIFRQVLEGLGNLHTMGVMHRDISPSNLLIFSSQTPATARAGIADFGKAKKGDRGTDRALGPPGFTSPEVGRSEEYTNAIDVFSLGLSMVATFVRWTGAEPMTAENHAKILAQLPRIDIPEGLEALLRSMLAWDPADRPTAEEALADGIWEQEALEPEQDEYPSSEGVATRDRRERSGGLSLSSSRLINKRARDSVEQGGAQSTGDKKKKTRKTGSPSHYRDMNAAHLAEE